MFISQKNCHYRYRMVLIHSHISGWPAKSCTTNLGWLKHVETQQNHGMFTTVFNWCRILQPSTVIIYLKFPQGMGLRQCTVPANQTKLRTSKGGRRAEGLSQCESRSRGLSNMVLWSIIINFDQFWPILINYDQLWSIIINYYQLWSTMIRFDQFWSIMINYDQFWSILINYVFKCTSLYIDEITITINRKNSTNPKFMKAYESPQSFSCRPNRMGGAFIKHTEIFRSKPPACEVAFFGANH